LLADLGFSSVQLESGRGFSFQKDEPLQMTYHSGERSAAEMVNSLPEKELADLIYLYGGERRSRRIAKAIVESRRASRILTTGQLTAVVAKALGASYEKGRINPATRTFQALRIAVNREMENVETLLGALPNVMKKGGRVAIITFHSLEDALVKNAFRNLAKAGRVELLTKKPIGPSRSEVIGNARARSAKVRAIRFL
jgi:16S rRNA (cytosine1402-N4)-methyltransferase